MGRAASGRSFSTRTVTGLGNDSDQVNNSQVAGEPNLVGPWILPTRNHAHVNLAQIPHPLGRTGLQSKSCPEFRQKCLLVLAHLCSAETKDATLLRRLRNFFSNPVKPVT